MKRNRSEREKKKAKKKKAVARRTSVPVEPPPPWAPEGDADLMNPESPYYDPIVADDIDEICRRAVARRNT